MQSSLLVAIGQVHVRNAGAGDQEDGHNLRVAGPGSKVEGRGARLVHRVAGRLVTEQETHHLGEGEERHKRRQDTSL